MSIFSSLQMAGNSLQAMQIGLHVVGNNIANANTPGYIRERTIYTPAPVQKKGNLTLGLGVQISGIVQNVDKFVEDRLRDAGSDRASADVKDKVYRDLQAILGELTDTDVSTALSDFFNDIDNISGSPDDIGIRGLAIDSGVKLTQRINQLDRRVRTVHNDLNTRIDDITEEINTLTEQIATLNYRIVVLEGGGSTNSDAGALRSQRNVAVKRLAELVDISANETPNGHINITVGSELIVFEGTSREVETVISGKEGLVNAEIEFVDNKSKLDVHSGELQGLYSARDEVLGGFLEGLDHFANNLAFEFNKLYSQGQAIEGFSSITSKARVQDPNAALDVAGLDFTPVNGEFNVIVRNKENETETTHTIAVDLNGLDGNDTTLASLAASIDEVAGISAKVSSDNRLEIKSDSEEVEFAFGIDPGGKDSGALAALGINTFFTGSNARNVSVNTDLTTGANQGSKFSASLDGIGEDTENALRLVGLYDESLEELDGNSIRDVYDQLLNETTQGATIAASVLEGLQVFEGTLDASSQAVSGVNLDEEAIDMIMLQRTYQASARYINTLTELLDILVNL